MARTIGSHGPTTLEAIRKAGVRLIFEHGYEAMSLRQLAAEVGIQPGSLYNHISTKQDLLFDLVQDHINDLLREFGVIFPVFRDALASGNEGNVGSVFFDEMFDCILN